jgi:hypothetical protein
MAVRTPLNSVLLAGSLLVLSQTVALQGQPAPSAGEDQSLVPIRAYALRYTKSLPDFTCTRVTDQKNTGATVAADHRLAVAQAKGGFKPAGITYEDQITFAAQRVNYKLLKIDTQWWTDRLKRGTVEANMGSPDAPPVTAFGSAIEHIFDPSTEAQFRWARFDELRGRRVRVFSFEVPRAHGATVHDGTLQHDVVVGYEGLVLADETSNAIVRIEMHSSDFPDDAESRSRAAFSGVDLAFDFGAVKLGGQEYFLPLRLHLQYHIHMPPGSGLRRTASPSVLALTEDFRNYGSVSVQSALAFDGVAKPPEASVRSTITFDSIAPPGEK